MDIKKLLLGGILAGVLFFLLGWLIYGNLLVTFIKNNPGIATGVNRDPKDIQFLYLVIGNLSLGFTLAYIFVRSNVSSLTSGLVTGGVVGLLFSVGMNCLSYATTFITSKKMMAADVIAIVVLWAIVGAIVGLLMGKLSKSAV